MRWILASSVILGAMPASATPVKTVRIVDDYSLAFRDHTIVIRRGKIDAKVLSAEALTGAKYDKATGQVTIDYDTASCANPTQATFSLALLKAKLDNEPAFALHRKKDWKTALVGFQRAQAADPTWVIPAYNAASAQQLLGDKDGAIATLAPWLKQQPVRTFVQIHIDPELAPLADRAEVKAVAAKQAGTVVVTRDGITGEAAYSSELKLVAVTRSERSWGGSQFMTEVALFDATGANIGTIPLVNFDETNGDCDSGDVKTCRFRKTATKALADRAAQVQQLLRELGFAAAKIERGTDRSDDAAMKIRFSKHKLGLVAADGKFRVLRNNTELVAAPLAQERLHDAMIVDAANAIVLWSGRPGAEGCESTDPTAVQIVAIPATP